MPAIFNISNENMYALHAILIRYSIMMETAFEMRVTKKRKIISLKNDKCVFRDRFFVQFLVIVVVVFIAYQFPNIFDVMNRIHPR